MNPSFFDDVRDSKLRDLLQKLLYETQEDLDNFQQELEKAGVDVVRIPAGTLQDGRYVESMDQVMADDWSNGGMPHFITIRGSIYNLRRKFNLYKCHTGTARVIKYTNGR